MLNFKFKLPVTVKLNVTRSTCTALRVLVRLGVAGVAFRVTTRSTVTVTP